MSAWLIDTLLYTGLLIGLVLVLRRPVGRFFGPQIAYGLWALPFLRLLLPPIVLPADFAPEPAAASAMAPGEWTPVVIDGPVEPAAAPVSVVASAAPPPPAWEWADLVAPAASVWAGVALAFLAWRVVTYRRMRRELLRGARPVGETGKIRLVETPALAAPVAFGVLDKVIALPPLFMAQPDIAARDLAISHELAHHKGHDLLANFAAQALLALHWFNPLAWYGWRAMRRDQEAACDARVVAGKGREERLRYAALIAGIATGPRSIAFRGALAAPMACPVLGERSIVHRLRSLSMSEMSRRRRWLGRTLVGASALALPLTASISYAAAQAPAPPAPPAPRAAELPPAPPAPPGAPEVRAGETHTFALQREGGEGERIVREVTVRAPQPPQPPQPSQPPQPPQFHWQGDSFGPEFQAEMEEFQREMETFRQEWADNQDWEKYAEEWEKWGEQFGQQWAEQHRTQALAFAEQARLNAPEVIMSCDAGSRPVRPGRSVDGRQQIVICEQAMHRMARSSLSSARNSIARNRQLSEEVRREVLRDLDAEIARMEREGD